MLKRSGGAATAIRAAAAITPGPGDDRAGGSIDAVIMPGTTLHLSLDSLLRDFSGVALVTDGEGRVLGWSPTAAPLASALRRGAHSAGLRALVTRTLVEGPRCETLKIGHQSIFDIALAPLVGDGVLIIGHDASFEHNLRQALADSRERYKDFVEASSDFAWETDADGAFVFVSPRGAFGYAAANLVGRDPTGFLRTDRAAPSPLPFHARAPAEMVEVWMTDADGAPTCLETSTLPRFDRDGRWLGARGICRDVTEARARDAALARAHRRERLVAGLVNTIREEPDPEKLLSRAAAATLGALAASACVIHRVGADGGLTRGARAGRPDKQWDKHVGDALRAIGDPQGAIEIDQGDLDHGKSRLLVAPARYRQSVIGAVAVARRAAWSDDDRTLLAAVAGHLGIAIEQIANHEALKALSRTDDLTGLHNRRAFIEEVGRRLAHARRTGRRSALLFIDLDNFKAVNDVHGHRRGDEALKRWAETLSRRTRTGDVTARLGGDEFAVWLEETDAEGAVTKARELCAAGTILAKFSGAPDRPLSVSIGVAVSDPAAGEALEALVTRADAAMYAAKRSGKAAFAMAPPANASGTGSDR